MNTHATKVKVKIRKPVVLLSAAIVLGGGLALAPSAGAATASFTSTATPAVFGCNYTTARPTLDKGDSGDAVREAQCLLNYWGSVPHLTVDGDFGTNTLASVKYFQTWYCSLTVDGEIGPNTWRALDTSGC